MTDLSALAVTGTNNPNKQVSKDRWNSLLAAIEAMDDEFQPVSSDLTAIDALTTTPFGRSLLTLADAAALAAAHDHDSTYLNQGSNLSDVANAATARDNLGVEIGTDVQAFDATLMPAEWTLNFSDDGDVYIAAVEEMTISQGNAKIGTGTLTFTKSTTAAPSTFGAASLPATLEAGAWLKVAATGVSGFVATHLTRTA